MKTHLASFVIHDDVYSVCGRVVPFKHYTLDRAKITCKSCKRYTGQRTHFGILVGS